MDVEGAGVPAPTVPVAAPVHGQHAKLGS